MCGWINIKIPASHYLTQAKKRNRDLKKLKSVSRAYRKSQVRALKSTAAAIMARDAFDRQAKEAERFRMKGMNGYYNAYNSYLPKQTTPD